MGVLPEYLRRELYSHKGDYGVVLGVGGSFGMSGAISFAGRASLLVGAGLSRLAAPDSIYDVVAGLCPESTIIPLPSDRNGKISLRAFDVLIDRANGVSSVFIGAGLGRSAGLDRLTFNFLSYLGGVVNLSGVVVDADGLNALCGCVPVFVKRNVIFTPHAAEFSRLICGAASGAEFNETLSKIQEKYDRSNLTYRINVTKKFAQEHNIVTVLKGHETIVTDGDEVFINNMSGNPGMATGGSGDVLTGMIAGLLARGFSVFDAAKLGVYLHGAAGDAAEKFYGQESLIATHILEHIPTAIKNLKNNYD
ncbi:MAG: NAD(P)H-hydrate dehydratase [Planctomycetaceae bacterium]|nr:NAD(P)H-hydrate dehydratase [Planctomycetaceae bacterium]